MNKSAINKRFTDSVNYVIASGLASNKTIIAEALGISKSKFSEILNFRMNVSIDTIAQFCTVYNIDTNWLLTGRGDMFKNERLSIVENLTNNLVGEAEVLYQHKSKAIERFWNEQEVPLYELDAAAGLSAIFSNNRQNIINFIKIPDLPKCDGAVYARGDSMYPIIKSGDIIIFKEVTDVKYLLYGEMHLIDYSLNNDDYLVIKYIQESEIERHIKLVSHNPHHSSLDIPTDSIRAVAIIKASVRLNTLK
ncbi:MAG: transcriptional regulator [Prevotellaceae bacterium]|jgi:phage repressor protein C with HTH and peptisase S24 domain|nr:transcriptional regulator [Prevotellaceae bacterium]